MLLFLTSKHENDLQFPELARLESQWAPMHVMMGIARGNEPVNERR